VVWVWVSGAGFMVSHHFFTLLTEFKSLYENHQPKQGIEQRLCARVQGIQSHAMFSSQFNASTIETHANKKQSKNGIG